LLIAFAPSGEYKWSVAMDYLGQVTFQPDSTILVSSTFGSLTNIGLDGALRGIIEGSVSISTGPTLAADSTVYAYRERSNEKLACALNPDGSEQWAVPIAGTEPGTILSVALGDDGTVYFGAGGQIYAMSSGGTKKWVYPTNGDDCLPLAIGADGAVFASVKSNDSPDRIRLIALNADGSLRWDHHFDGYALSTPPTIDGNGTVYVGVGGIGTLYALNPDGTLKWTFDTPADISGVSIGEDGTLYFGNEVGYVYAIGPGEG
jgi:outer membrane protein assembly factor BamB